MSRPEEQRSSLVEHPTGAAPEAVDAYKERRFDSYIRLLVEWDEDNGGVTSYFTDAVSLTTGWVSFDAEGWMWATTRDGANTREYFDEPQRMAIPTVRVREVYWPKDKG